MNGALIPFVLAVIALSFHMLLFGGVRFQLHKALDQLSEDIRDDLGWPRVPMGLWDNSGYRQRKVAATRLTYWALPQGMGLPEHVLELERQYRKSLFVDACLMLVVLAAFALAAPGAWIISLIGLAGLVGVTLACRYFVDPWPSDRGQTVVKSLDSDDE